MTQELFEKIMIMLFGIFIVFCYTSLMFIDYYEKKEKQLEITQLLNNKVVNAWVDESGYPCIYLKLYNCFDEPEWICVTRCGDKIQIKLEVHKADGSYFSVQTKKIDKKNIKLFDRIYKEEIKNGSLSKVNKPRPILKLDDRGVWIWEIS